MLEVRPGGEHERDEHRREPREAPERLAAELGRDRPDRDDERRRARRSRATRRRGAPSRRARTSHDEPGSTASWPESERPEAKPSESASAGHEQRRPVGQPREVDERGDEREAERHQHERLAEARPAGDRREVAVEELPERELEHVLAAEAEREDADLEHADDADPGEREQRASRPRGGTVRPRRQRSRKPSEPISEREREEVQPAHDVLGPRRAARAVRLGRRQRRHAHAERPHARDDVRVGRERVPADRVRARRAAAGRARSPRRPDRARGQRVVPAVHVEHLDGRELRRTGRTGA